MKEKCIPSAWMKTLLVAAHVVFELISDGQMKVIPKGWKMYSAKQVILNSNPPCRN